MHSFRKSKKIYQKALQTYKKRKKELSEVSQSAFEETLKNLYRAIENQQKEEAKDLSIKLKELIKNHLPKSFFGWVFEQTIQLAFALVFAIIIRQMCFEFYVVPTGSMRPTFKEGDYVVVAKNTYSLNVPLKTQHFFFDEKAIQRGNIVVFTSENLDMADSDTMYFGLFPGKKQLVKRLVGKPGDTLYFYGGKIYGIDQNKQPIQDFNDLCFKDVEYIPFLQPGGMVKTMTKRDTQKFNSSIIYQMNQPIAKLFLKPLGSVQGKMLSPNPTIKDYHETWGIGNFAMTRILTKEQYEAFTNKPSQSAYYMEFLHHPSFEKAGLKSDMMRRIRPDFSYKKSYIALDDDAMERIFAHMNTVRFCVQNERAFAYGRELHPLFSPFFAGIPDGTYEFDKGTLYQIGHANVALTLDENHPLKQYSPEKTALLYNLGVEFDLHYLPKFSEQILKPSRYSYFRDGNLYTMHAPIFLKEDPNLKSFVKNEKTKPLGFFDLGAPLLKNGAIDVQKIEQFGLSIPEKSYLVLGDNHAVSGDSRVFGFVPEENFKGTASHVFWPFGNRFGFSLQPKSLLSLPRVVVWLAFFAVSLLFYLYYRRKWKNPPEF